MRKKDFCIGCGACKFACPQKCVKLQEDVLGRYEMVIAKEQCLECGICEKVCPIYENILIPKQAQYNTITGNYLNCYKGYDDRYRKTSASGGLLTSFLYGLLKGDIVDTVVCLKENSDSTQFYKYSFVSEPSRLIQNSKSAYYPVEMSEMIEYILKNDARYAIVVLPCQAKAIRILQKRYKKLEERILVLAGLVCGGMPGKGLVEYISNFYGHSLDEVKRITFREKEKNVTNSNYSIKLQFTNNEVIRSHFRQEEFGFAYLNKLFHYKACNLCNDIFAEYADIVFMDAWLQEHRDDELGTSICIVRNENIAEFTNNYFTQIENVKVVTIDSAIQAQSNVGLVLRKKKQNIFKYKFYASKGFRIPYSISNMQFSLKEITKFSIRGRQEYAIQNYAEKQWVLFKQKKISIEDFYKKMHRYVKWIKII